MECLAASRALALAWARSLISRRTTVQPLEPAGQVVRDALPGAPPVGGAVVVVGGAVVGAVCVDVVVGGAVVGAVVVGVSGRLGVSEIGFFFLWCLWVSSATPKPAPAPIRSTPRAASAAGRRQLGGRR